MSLNQQSGLAKVSRTPSTRMPPQSRSESPAASYSRSPPRKDMKDPRRNYPNHKHNANADGSDSSSVANSAAAPSSVYLGSPVALTRELSDLSGSYMSVSGSVASAKGSSIPGHIYDLNSSVKGPWRQAYVLSRQPPQHLQRMAKTNASDRDDTIYVDRNDFVEVVKRQDSATNSELGLINHESVAHHRIPVVLLLMDPGRKIYELMQLWVDRSADSVRDVLNAMQQSIPDKWKQAYDGLFQIRGSKFTQLINILSVAKYNLQPYEIWVAKPWSVPSKVAIACANALVRHLIALGMATSYDDEIVGKRMLRTKTAESALRFSAKARSRIYAPDGIFNHHHAVQFVTLSPPMDVNHRWPVEFAPDRDDNSSVTADSDPNMKSKSIVSSMNTGVSESDQSTKNPTMTRRAGTSLSHHSASRSPIIKASADFAYAEEKKEDPTQRRSIGNIVSKLNCSRCRKEEKQISAGSSTGPAIMTLTEAQQQRWMSSFDITGPIAEDVSVAGYSTQSGVSMSATPLLKSQGARNPSIARSARRPDNGRLATF